LHYTNEIYALKKEEYVMYSKELNIQLVAAAKEGQYEQLLGLLEVARQEKSFINLNEPLSWAAHNGHFNAVKVLLDHGADINFKDAQDNTPLHWAAYNAHADVIKLLISRGANELIMNKNSLTPAKFAQINSNHNNQHKEWVVDLIKEISQLKKRLSDLENALADKSSPMGSPLLNQCINNTDAQAVSRLGLMKGN
jgi:hypothetical protein